jgi:hypothetical protein
MQNGANLSNIKRQCQRSISEHIKLLNNIKIVQLIDLHNKEIEDIS